jgi:Predicted permease
MDNKKLLQTICIFSVFIIFFVLLICMMYPFWTVILWTMLLYILIRPLYQKCVGKPDPQNKSYTVRRYVFSGIFSIGTLILIIVPIIILSILLIHQLISFLSSAESFLASHSGMLLSNGLVRKIVDYAGKLGISIPEFDITDAHASVLSFLHVYKSRLFLIAKQIVSSAGAFLVSLLFIVFALYFCFLDGSYLSSVIKKAIPIKPAYMSVLVSKFAEITRSLFSGYILVALYQGVASFIIMLIFKVHGALLFSVVLMFASFIPMFGTALIWFPIGLVICVTDSLWKGVTFLVISAICVSLLDNFLRPFFLKERIHVHPLIIFFAILGGLRLFGMNGLILGPMIVIMFFTVLDLLVNVRNDGLSVQETDDDGEPPES